MGIDYILPENSASIAGGTNLNKWLKLFNLNARSLSVKGDDVPTLLQACNVKFYVLMFAETWHTEYSDHYIPLDYSHFDLIA